MVHAGGLEPPTSSISETCATTAPRVDGGDDGRRSRVRNGVYICSTTSSPAHLRLPGLSRSYGRRPRHHVEPTHPQELVPARRPSAGLRPGRAPQGRRQTGFASLAPRELGHWLRCQDLNLDVKSQALLPPTIIKLAGYCTPFSPVTGLVSCPFVVVPASASGQIDVACWLVFVASFAR